jgi:radical SAM superfamily enzyme YgiQ (UPF0313 family)|tara:strand:- start:18706 stop:20172 length:1467 start_codon:yes stop_codon:yes gene_type:complete
LLLKKNNEMISSKSPSQILNVVLISLYDLGHQPLSIASAAALLKEYNCNIEIIELSNLKIAKESIKNAELILLSVPMHTAARMAVKLVPELRKINSDAHISIFGLYALHLQDALDERIIDSAISGEFESSLKVLVEELLTNQKEDDRSINSWISPKISFERQIFLTPSRENLPPLEQYAKMSINNSEKLTGYIETSHGCAHSCPHCPVTAVYQGKFRIVDKKSILKDVDNLIKIGAEHFTFGDPDFFNAPKHSLDIASSIKKKYPHITFDATIKVEHILEHKDLIKKLKDMGFLFIISAFESTNNHVLNKLEKGHLFNDMQLAIDICKSSNLIIKPTWIPFTPWMQFSDYPVLINFIIKNDLMNLISPVQYGIRLLIPKLSTLVSQLNEDGISITYSKEKLTYEWDHLDPNVDILFEEITNLINKDINTEELSTNFFDDIYNLVQSKTNNSMLPYQIINHETVGSTEDWYCCAEPTNRQILSVDSILN